MLVKPSYARHGCRGIPTRNALTQKTRADPPNPL